jgi:hypothetical protein
MFTQSIRAAKIDSPNRSNVANFFFDMNLQTKINLAACDRDLRLDFARGIAIWFLFLDHIPNNAVSLLTMRNFGFSGATDLFVFAAGYAAAIFYGKMLLERGVVVTTTRIFKRVWHLYAAYVVLFVIYVDTIGNVAAQYAAPEIIGEFNVSGIIDHPIRILMHGLLLQAKPLNLDVLQLFIALMALFPVALLGMFRWPSLTMVGSLGLYLAAREFDWNLASFPDGRWYFNPFCWQLLFVLGIWCALVGARLAHLVRRLPLVRIAALTYLLFALIITIAGKSPTLASFIPDWLIGSFLPNDKENLALYRVLHLLALAFLFTRIVPNNSHGFAWKALQPVLICGEEWLTAFCAGVFLSFAGHLLLITGPNSIAMQLLVSAAGISIMTCAAYYVSWSKRQDYKSAFGARS